MDSLSLNQIQWQMMFDLRVAFAGVRCEIFFGENLCRACFMDQFAQNIKRLSTSNYRIRTTRAQIFIKLVQAFVEKILSARRSRLKGGVEDKERDYRASPKCGEERWVIR